MKPKKKKFDIKAFCINHCEKFAFALMIPLAIYIGLEGTKFVPLPWQPDALQKAADESEAFVKKNERKAVDEGVSVTNYDVKAEWIKVPLRATLYQTNTKWMPSLFPEKNKRAGVEVFSVTDLIPHTGLGAIGINSNTAEATALGFAPGTTKIGRRWVVLTGLIPIKKQLELYVSTFTSSVLTDPTRDTPQYYFYEVERAEISPTSDLNNLKWEKLDVFGSFSKDQILWSGTAVDPVDPTFLAPIPAERAVPMAYPLPPVESRFGEEVTHPPVVPMLTDSQMKSMKLEEQFQKKFIKQSLEKINEKMILEHDPFGTQDKAALDPTQQNPLAQEHEDESTITVTDYLFRFFDFSVETGKSYRYRVRLYVANPNYKLAEKWLEEPSLAKERFLITPFSTASATVTVPLGSRVLTSAVTAAGPRTPWAEPSASLYAIYFDMNDGSEWYVEKDRVFRGQTINYSKGEAIPFETKSAENAGLDGMPMPPQPKPGPRPRDTRKPAPPTGPEKRTVEIVSDVCVLDMFGGALLPKTGTGNVPDLRSPGKVLVLEPSGAMVVRKVDADLHEIDRLKNPVPLLGGGIISSPRGGSGDMGGGSP